MLEYPYLKYKKEVFKKNKIYHFLIDNNNYVECSF